MIHYLDRSARYHIPKSLSADPGKWRRGGNMLPADMYSICLGRKREGKRERKERFSQKFIKDTQSDDKWREKNYLSNQYETGKYIILQTEHYD